MIVTDEEALRVKCEDVLPEEVDELRDKLEKALKQSALDGAPGIGLAAPQIGIAKRMAIVRLGDYKIDLVNASIGEGYDLDYFDNEGCLSFPGRTEKTKRFKEVHILDNMVEPKRFVATGLLAVVCQHELDHTRGVLLPDVAIEQTVVKKKVRPNDPCSCGSGKKFKKCCKK